MRLQVLRRSCQCEGQEQACLRLNQVAPQLICVSTLTKMRPSMLIAFCECYMSCNAAGENKRKFPEKYRDVWRDHEMLEQAQAHSERLRATLSADEHVANAA